MVEISLDDHKTLGILLKKSREAMIIKLLEYKTNKEANKSYENKAINLIDKLRDVLDDIAFRDYYISAYYGKPIETPFEVNIKE
jgi:hypothetical protein